MLGKCGWEESQYKHVINHQVFPFLVLSTLNNKYIETKITSFQPVVVMAGPLTYQMS